MTRFYCPSPFSEGACVALPEGERHHLLHVLRLRLGARIRLANGKGQGAEGELVELSSREAIVRLSAVSKECLPPLILALGIPLFSHLAWTIEKSTELGVSAFWLFPADKSEKRGLSPAQMMRLRKLTIAAMKQSGRLSLPEIVVKEPLKAWQPGEELATRLWADPHPSAPFLQELTDLKMPALVYIGPESGWSEEERAVLEKQHGAQRVRLHTHTLRAETAAIAAATVLMCRTNAC